MELLVHAVFCGTIDAYKIWSTGPNMNIRVWTIRNGEETYLETIISHQRLYMLRAGMQPDIDREIRHLLQEFGKKSPK